MNRKIRFIHVSCPGDRSVGLDGESAFIKADGDFLTNLGILATEDCGTYLDELRKKIRETFAFLWGDSHVMVFFDFELDEDVDQNLLG